MCRRSTFASLALGLVAAALVSTSAWGAAPEFGRCVAVAAGTGGYSNAGCTAAGGSKKFQWLPGPGPKSGFTAVIKPATTLKLESVGKTKIACTGLTVSGSVLDAVSVLYGTFTFTGCQKENAKKEHFTCATRGGPAGTVALGPLGGRLGVIKTEATPVKNKIGLQVRTFDEEIQCGIESVSVLGNITVPVKTNKMAAAETLKFAETAGVQKPLGFEGERPRLEFNFEQGGLGVTALQSYEENIEVNSVV
jgi:hypothetical protein